MPTPGPGGHGDLLVLMERAAIALAIGMMVGLEREWARKDVGARTFAFVALNFALAWIIAPTAAYILLAGLIPLVTLINWRSLTHDGTLEMTTTAALVATALLGILVGQGQFLVAAACGVAVTGLLAWKFEVVRFAGALTSDEIRGAVILLVVTLVVFPLLPSGTVDPWGLVNVRSAWIVVVVISAIGFTNYVLLRIYGTRGIAWTGFLGGLVNSTATVAELASRAREGSAELTRFALAGMTNANTAMLLRNGVILGIFAPRALGSGWLAVGLMGAVSAGTAYRLRGGQATAAPLRLQSPVSLRQALTFGALFLLITLCGHLAARAFGQAGFLIVAALGGLVSSASTTAAAGILSGQGTLTPQLAGYSVVVACMTSLLFHVPIVQLAGRDGHLTRRLAAVIALVLAAGLVGLAGELLLEPHL